MGFQQIADHLFIPTHIAIEAYELGCKRGIKARIPKVRRQAFVKVDPKQEAETIKKYERGAKKKRSRAWAKQSASEKKRIRAEKVERKRKKKTRPKKEPKAGREARLAKFKASQKHL